MSPGIREKFVEKSKIFVKSKDGFDVQKIQNRPFLQKRIEFCREPPEVSCIDLIKKEKMDIETGNGKKIDKRKTGCHNTIR